jgi:hypothetical protein
MKSSQLTAEVSCIIKISLILFSVILLQHFSVMPYVAAQVGGDARGGDATGGNATGEVTNCYHCTITQAPVGGNAQGGNAIGEGSMPPGTMPSESMANAQMTMVYPEQNVWFNGQKGMKIHVSFDTVGLKGKDANVAVYFYFANGVPILSSPFQSATLKSVDNQVSVSTNLNILNDPSSTTDLQLFMPYFGLNLYRMPIAVDVAFIVVVSALINGSPMPLASSPPYFFTYFPMVM